MKLKKFLAGVIAVATVSSMMAMPVSADIITIGQEDSKYSLPAEPGTYKVGDVTGDDKVNVSDLIAIRSNILHKEGFDDVSKNRCADVNSDEKVNVSDLINLRSYILHTADISVPEFTIYEEGVFASDNALPALDYVANLTSSPISEATVTDVSNAIIEALSNYASLTDEEKANVDSSKLANALVEKATALFEALQNADETTAEVLAETISNIVKVYETLGIDKNTLIAQVNTLLADNNITIDANTQAYLLSVMAQFKKICDANNGVITGEQLLAIINSLKAAA